MPGYSIFFFFFSVLTSDVRPGSVWKPGLRLGFWELGLAEIEARTLSLEPPGLGLGSGLSCGFWIYLLGGNHYYMYSKWSYIGFCVHRRRGGEEPARWCWRHDAVCDSNEGEPWREAVRKLRELSVFDFQVEWCGTHQFLGVPIQPMTS